MSEDNMCIRLDTKSQGVGRTDERTETENQHRAVSVLQWRAIENNVSAPIYCDWITDG